MARYNFFVVRGWAHRLLSNGQMESTPVHQVGEEFVVTNDWRSRNEADMDLLGADANKIRNDLELYSFMLRPDFEIPKPKKPEPPKEGIHPV